MPDDSKAIPILKVEDQDVVEKPRLVESAAAKLYNDVRPGVVRIEAGQMMGSGFALDSRRFVTNYHVVAEQPESVVKTQDGLRYRARIVKVDDVKDLAVLEIVGDTPKVQPLKLGDENKLAEGQSISAFGHPEGVGPALMSPGKFRSFTTNEERLAPEVRKDFDTLRLDNGDKADWLKNRLLAAEIGLRHGNSGGPVVDDKGTVVGVTTYKSGTTDGFMVPASELKALIAGTKNKYEFNYQYQVTPNGFADQYNEMLRTKPVGTLAVTAGLAGAEFFALRKLGEIGRGAGVMTAGYGGLSLVDDVPRLLDATNNRDRLKYGLATVGDTSILAGGALRFALGDGAREILRPALSSSIANAMGPRLVTSFGAEVLGSANAPIARTLLSGSERALASSAGTMVERYLTRAGKVGIGLVAVGVAIKFGSEYIPTSLVNTSTIRLDGKPQREPFFLGSKNATP